MPVNTRVFGPIEVREEDVILFPEGLYGLEHLRRFTLIDMEASRPWQWLQSLDDGEIALVVIDPWLVDPAYAPDVPDRELSKLGASSGEEVFLLAIAVVPEAIRDITVNLHAPLMIHATRRLGRQIILEGDRYAIKHRVFPLESDPAVAVVSASDEVSAAPDEVSAAS